MRLIMGRMRQCSRRMRKRARVLGWEEVRLLLRELRLVPDLDRLESRGRESRYVNKSGTVSYNSGSFVSPSFSQCGLKIATRLANSRTQENELPARSNRQTRSKAGPQSSILHAFNPSRNPHNNLVQGLHKMPRLQKVLYFY
jgi:hypothetical protein